jgi:hypothetical protein
MKKSNNSYRQTSIEYDKITFDIEYDFYPSERQVSYYEDMSGYPGSPAEVEINSIKIGEFEVYDVLHENVIEDLIEKIIEQEEG